MSSLAFSHEISPFLEGTADEKKTHAPVGRW